MKAALLSLCFLTVPILSAQMKTQEMSNSANATGQVIQLTSNIWDVFKSRRSVRAFKSDSIPEVDILKILDAARLAPTSGNQQPWKFLVIRDKNKIDQMNEKCMKGH